MIRVSIVVPVYNQHAPFVAQCINSCVSQIVPRDVEVQTVIVDDGSTNNWYDEVDLTGVKFIRNESNNGAPAAANQGIRESNGDFIQVLSSDDYFYQHKTEVQLGLMRNHNLDMTYTGGAEFWLSPEHSIDSMRVNMPPDIHSLDGKVHFDEMVKKDFGNNFVNGASTMFTRELFDKVGGYDETLIYKPDYDMWLRMFSICKAAGVPLDLMARRNHDNQTKDIMRKAGKKPERYIRSIEYAKIKLKWKPTILPVTQVGIDIDALRQEGLY